MSKKLPKDLRLSPQQIASVKNFSIKDYERDPIPFRSPKKIEALKRGEILPKEIEENLMVEKTEEGIDIYPADDPHWHRMTSALMSPLVETMDERRKVLLAEDPDLKNFFVKHEVNTESFNLLIRVQGAYGICPSETFNVMKKWKVSPNEETYINLIGNSKSDKALEYFSEMIHKKFSPSIYSYGALVKSMCNSNKTEEASEIVEVMRANNLHPNSVIYTTVLAGFIKSGDLTRAWKYFDQLKLLRVEIDQVLYGVMMNAAAEVGQIERANLFLEEMEKVAMPPTEVNYNILIKACSKRKGKLDLAFEYYNKMQMSGFQGDIYTFNALIQVCAKVGNVVKIMEVLEEMEKSKVSPTKTTFELVIHGLAINQESIRRLPDKVSENIGKAMTIFNEMKAKDMVTIGTLNVLLSVFTKPRLEKESVRFFREEYKKYELTPNAVTYTQIISMYTKLDKTYLAKKYFKEMLKNEMTPTYSSCKQIAYGYAVEGKTEKAYEWLQEVLEKYGYMLSPPDILGLKARVAGAHKKRSHLRHVEKNLHSIAPKTF